MENNKRKYQISAGLKDGDDDNIALDNSSVADDQY